VEQLSDHVFEVEFSDDEGKTYAMAAVDASKTTAFRPRLKLDFGGLSRSSSSKSPRQAGRALQHADRDQGLTSEPEVVGIFAGVVAHLPLGNAEFSQGHRVIRTFGYGSVDQQAEDTDYEAGDADDL